MRRAIRAMLAALKHSARADVAVGRRRPDQEQRRQAPHTLSSRSTERLPGGGRSTPTRRRRGARRSKRGVDGLALHREHAEHTLVDAVKRLTTHEALERLDAEPELTDRERALRSETP